MKLVFGEDQAVAQWVARRLDHLGEGGFGPCTAIGVADASGEPVAGAVYHGYCRKFGTIEMSLAAVHPRWSQRGVIRALLHYPFVQLGCMRVAAAIPHTNERAIKLVKGIGFKQEGCLRRGFGRDHALILGMLRHEFDRLFNKEPRHGQEDKRLATRAA